MLIDARNVPNDTVIESDICIVGAGAAGITLAREFIGKQHRVSLIESGGLDFDPGTQELAKGESIGQAYMPLESTRLRLFGGTTTHWGGTCRPLDEMDFEPKEWIPYSGWPFSKSHLDPFYERAQSVCQLGPYDYRVPHWVTAKTPVFPLKDNRLFTDMFQQSPPTRFGTTYRDEVIKAPNITTYIYANLVDIETSEQARQVRSLRIATLTGIQLKFKGKIFIIAAGAIENARLLLLARNAINAGVGNQNDLVGRFFMEHPILFTGIIALSDPKTSVDFYEKHLSKGVMVKGFLKPSDATRRREQLVNCGTRPVLTPLRVLSGGIKSYRLLKHSLAEFHIPDNFLTHLKNVIADIDDVVMRRGATRVVALKYWSESTPNPDSRITLSETRDALGKNQIRLDWQLNEIDRRTMSRVLNTIAEELGKSNLGRLQLFFSDEDNWPSEMAGSYHHMGTTRMNLDPKQGVVNQHCQVHETENLYIAGSSVYPTCGHANPTLTIVALSIRLADHIKKILS